MGLFYTQMHASFPNIYDSFLLNQRCVLFDYEQCKFYEYYWVLMKLWRVEIKLDISEKRYSGDLLLTY